jgi:hypothetical protein
MRLGASILIGACILPRSAAIVPAMSKSGDLAPFDAGYPEAAASIDGSRQIARQNVAAESDQSSAAERRPRRVLRKLLGKITIRLVTIVNSMSKLVHMVTETRTVETRMTPEPDLAAKPSHTAAPVRLGGGREQA